MLAEKNVTVNTGDPLLDTKIKQWLVWDENKETIEEVKSLLRENDRDKLSRLFLGRIEFGTAGLRGRMGAGYTKMNDLVVIQTAQGIAQYLVKMFKGKTENGIVVGYDGRYNSKRFAELTAAVFLNENFKVYLFSEVCPTPFVSFSVTYYSCLAGIMVTASHNPKEDNGYKVYWENGAQIISPHDKQIQSTILSNVEPLRTSWDTSCIANNCNVIDPLKDIMEAYYNKLQQIVVFPVNNKMSNLKIVYTPMHGVGYNYAVEAFRVGNFNEFYTVEEQKHPDPEFPTVRFPNPEEGKSALQLSIKTAQENGCTLILANDPDADRLAVAEKIPNTINEWKIFTGNEIGALLGWWSIFCYKHKNPMESDLKNVYMLYSTVSSKILLHMADSEGFQCEETLTGFKWLGNVAYDLKKRGNTVLFAFEEAIGFMCGTEVLDKDGISAAVKVAEMTAYLKQIHSMTLQEKLVELYKTYGLHLSLNSYFVCHEPTIVTRIFEKLRNYKENTNQSYPESICNGKYTIYRIRDLTTGYDNGYPDCRARLPTSKSSQMITFYFNIGLDATLRTSGTEPKIKYYTEFHFPNKNTSEKSLGDTKEMANEVVNAVVEELLEPSKNGLIPRSE